MPLNSFQSPLYLFTYAFILLLHLNKPKQETVKQILRCLKIWQKIYRSPLAQWWSTSRLVHWCNSGGNLEKGPRHLSLCTDRHRVLQEKVEKRSLSVPSPSLPWTVSLFPHCFQIHLCPRFVIPRSVSCPDLWSIPCSRHCSSCCTFLLRKIRLILTWVHACFTFNY